MADNAETPVMVITVDGIEYRLDVTDCKHTDEQDLYRACKMTIPGIVNAVQDGQVALFMVAALVFMARRQAGDKTANYDEIASAITYGTDIDIEVDNGDDGDPVGEAPADN